MAGDRGLQNLWWEFDSLIPCLLESAINLGFPRVMALFSLYLYRKSFINTYWYIFNEIILLHLIILKHIYHDHLFFRINNPILSDTCCTIFKQFCHIISRFATWRDNFNSPIRSAMTSFFIQFRRITNNRYIWFQIIYFIFIQKHSKWRWKHLTFAIIFPNIHINLCVNEV